MGAMVLWASLLTQFPWWCWLLPSFLLWLWMTPGGGVKAKLDHGLGLDGAWLAGQWSIPGLGLPFGLRPFLPLVLGLLFWGWSGAGFVKSAHIETLQSDTHASDVNIRSTLVEHNQEQSEAMQQGEIHQGKEGEKMVVVGLNGASDELEECFWSMEVWLSKRPFRSVL
jgi:hypothetical protein